MLSATEDHQLKNFLCANVLAICVFSVKCYSIPEPRFEPFSYGGFTISIPDTPEQPRINLVAFHWAVDRQLKGGEIGDFFREVLVPKCDRWEYTFHIPGFHLKPGQRIYYWIHVKRGFKRYRLLNKYYEILDNGTLFYYPPICKKTGDCEWSETTVQGQKVCQGELIFEEDFDVLDSVVWKREIRIPLDVDDGDFVVYQDRNGELHIQQTRLDMVPGYSEATVRNGEMDLGEKCTLIYNREWECRRQASSFKILPPVVSARINTKQSFSFRYGKIEIRAKLPKGDWLIPLLALDPLTSDYGMTGYQSGQIRVAYIRANEHLKTKEDSPIDGSRLSFRIFPPLENTTVEYYSTLPTNNDQWRHIRVHWGNAFHTYTLTWSENSIRLSVDQDEYVSLVFPNGTPLFNKEFYISLGLSAGGMSDFPDGCISNGNHKPWEDKHPKAELRFWNARDKWYPTWRGIHSSLIIDYVKVWAL